MSENEELYFESLLTALDKGHVQGSKLDIDVSDSWKLRPVCHPFHGMEARFNERGRLKLYCDYCDKELAVLRIERKPLRVVKSKEAEMDN